MRTAQENRGPRLVWWSLLTIMLLVVPLTTELRGESCVPAHSGTCNGHPPCDSANPAKHCRDTLTKSGYDCECRTGKDMRTPRHHCREDEPCIMEGVVPPRSSSSTPNGQTSGSGGGPVYVPGGNDQGDHQQNNKDLHHPHYPATLPDIPDNNPQPHG